MLEASWRLLTTRKDKLPFPISPAPKESSPNYSSRYIRCTEFPADELNALPWPPARLGNAEYGSCCGLRAEGGGGDVWRGGEGAMGKGGQGEGVQQQEQRNMDVTTSTNTERKRTKLERVFAHPCRREKGWLYGAPTTVNGQSELEEEGGGRKKTDMACETHCIGQKASCTHTQSVTSGFAAFLLLTTD